MSYRWSTSYTSLLGVNRNDIITDCVNPQLGSAQLPGNVVTVCAYVYSYMCPYERACVYLSSSTTPFTGKTGLLGRYPEWKYSQDIDGLIFDWLIDLFI